MALTTTRVLCNTPTKSPYTAHFLRRPIFFPSNPCGSPPFPSRISHIVSFAKKLSSRTGKLDSKNKRSSTSTKEEGDERTAEIESPNGSGGLGIVDFGVVENFDGYILSDLPGTENDFWEGHEWDAFGFFI